MKSFAYQSAFCIILLVACLPTLDEIAALPSDKPDG